MKKLMAIPLALVLVLGMIALPIQTIAQNGEDEFTVEVNVENSEIVRGNIQTIDVDASAQAKILGTITYASSFERTFTGTTDEDGALQYEWRIGPNSNPGTFNVEVTALATEGRAFAQGSASFTVTEAAAETEPEPPITEVPGTGGEVDNGSISEGNGTVVVPEEPIPLPGNETAEGAGNETAPPTEEPEIPPIVNETIPIPVPSNETSTNETEPVELPINQTTGGNETVPIPELPVEPTVPGTEEPAAENQTETLPEEIPAANETNTVPIPLPINETTGNETIPIPELPVEVNETSPVPEPEATPTPEPTPEPPFANETETPAGNETTEAPPPITPETPASDIIDILDERVDVLENATSSQTDVFITVGQLGDLIAKALAVVPELTEDEQQAITDKAKEAVDKIAALG